VSTFEPPLLSFLVPFVLDLSNIDAATIGPLAIAHAPVAVPAISITAPANHGLERFLQSTQPDADGTICGSKQKMENIVPDDSPLAHFLEGMDGPFI
jgi:hypothetical protein